MGAGLDPHFPAEDDDRCVGAVFTTKHGEATTVWVVTSADPGRRIAYARVTSGATAGTVEVACQELGHESTQVTVTYRLTALTEQGREPLADFASEFGPYIRGWRQNY